MADYNSVINNYTYSYQGQMYAKFDKNDDAVWSKSELTEYATAYNKATGKTLDVDALMEQYGNSNGTISYAQQKQMMDDDALGFSVLKAGTAATDSDTSSSTSATAAKSILTAKGTMTQEQKDFIFSAVSKYSYEYSGTLNPLLDKNTDGVWSKDELTNYAEAYSKATGKTLDVDELMEKYGNENGVIDPTNQAAMKKADALGLSNLMSAYNTALTTATDTSNLKQSVRTEDTTMDGKSSASGLSMADMLSNMSSSQKMFFSMRVNQLDNMSSMLNSFGFGSSSSSGLDVLGLLSSSSTLNSYKAAMATDSEALSSAMSGQLMNYTF